MKAIVLFGFLLFSFDAAFAAMDCVGMTEFGDKIQIRASEDFTAAYVSVIDPTGERSLEASYRTISRVDGHAFGLVTAPGLSIFYRNDYGCFHDVRVTTNIRRKDNTTRVGLFSETFFAACNGERASVCSRSQARPSVRRR